MNLKKNICLFACFIFCVASISSQANFKVGYNLGYTQLSKVNDVQNAYNLSKSGIVEPLKEIHWLHGIEVGFRQKWENVGVELTYNNLGRERSATGLEGANDSVFETSISYSVRTFSLALENYFGGIGYGASLGTSKFKVRSDIPGINSTKRKLVDQSNLSSQFYLILAVEGTKSVSLEFRPYFSIPWGKFNFSPLQDELDVDTSVDITGVNPKFFGISILFYNGPQY